MRVRPFLIFTSAASSTIYGAISRREVPKSVILTFANHESDRRPNWAMHAPAVPVTAQSASVLGDDDPEALNATACYATTSLYFSGLSRSSTRAQTSSVGSADSQRHHYTFSPVGVCFSRLSPVIVATQMMESMIKSPVPQRSEVQVWGPDNTDYPRTRWPQSPRIVMQCVSMIIEWPASTQIVCIDRTLHRLSGTAPLPSCSRARPRWGRTRSRPCRQAAPPAH